MLNIPPKAVEEFKELFNKKYGRKLSDSEAKESAQNLLNFFEVLYDISKEQYLREQKLKKNPNGFHLESNKYYSCVVCNKTIEGNTAWWDKYGTKCANCQKNIDKKILPKKLLEGKFASNNWFSGWQFKDKFNIHSSTLRKLVREGKLKSIKLKDENSITYHEIFPIKENIKFLKTLKHYKKN